MRRAVVFVVLCALFCAAYGGLVPCCDVANITAAINTAVNNDIISLPPGATFTGQCVGWSLGGSGKNLIFNGYGSRIMCSNPPTSPFSVFNLVNDIGADQIGNVQLTTAQRTNGTAIMMYNSVLTLSTISVINFDQGVYTSASSVLSVIGCNFANNHRVDPVHTSFCGGAIQALSSTLNVVSTLFNGNTATYGGAIFTDTCTTQINGMTCLNQEGSWDGGCLFMQRGTTYIQNSVFTGASAVLGTAGVMEIRYHMDVTILNSNFTNNYGSNVGCIRVECSNLRIAGCIFSGMSSASTAGTLAIYDSSQVAIDNSTFANNKGTYGGHIYMGSSAYTRLNVTRTNFTQPYKTQNDKINIFYADSGVGNFSRCVFNGGYVGIYTTVSGQAFVTDSNFTGLINAVQAYGGDMEFRRNTFNDNGLWGGSFLNGGVMNMALGNSYIVDNLFSNNAADYGALYIAHYTAQIYRNLFINNFSTKGGGAIYQVAGSHFITDCTFINNTVLDSASSIGGAININSVSPYLVFATISRCMFVGNAARIGGAISLATSDSNSFVTVQDCQFYNHTTFFNASVASTQFGGAVYMAMPLMIRNCLFVNSSSLLGGTLAAQNNFVMQLNNLTIRNSFATQKGGVLWATNAVIYINQVSANQMTAPSGGAFYGDTQSTYVVTNSSFTQNIAAGEGGAICAFKLLATNLYFSQNTAAVGGAVSGNGNGYISFTNSTFINNYASLNGGAVASSIQGSLTLVQSSLSGNIALNYGGAAFTDYVSGGVNIDRTTIRNNRANAGGGLYLSTVVTAGLTVLANTYVVDNTAGPAGGGGLYLAACMTLINPIITGNVSPLGSGGGILSTDVMDITGGLIDSNSASSGGGIYCRLCEMHLHGSLIISNNEATDGGGFWCNLGSVFDPAATVSFLGNNQTNDPVLSNKCDCGCCSVPEEPAFITSQDCVLSSDRACRYDCEIGYYKSDDNGIFTCDTSVASNPFITPDPLCKPCACPTITPHANCSIDQPMAAVTSNTATFYADLGYTLSSYGNKTVTCRGPVWLGDYPDCIPNLCPPLALVANGHPSNFTGRTGDTVEYICDIGFTRQGSQFTSCLTSGQWSDPPATCQSIGCSVLSAPGNGSIYIDAQPATGATATFQCNAGYLLIGNETIQCLGGNWSDVSPRCQAKPCDPLDPIANGDISNANGSTNSYAEFNCHTGFYLVGASRLLCFAPNWQGTSPICRPVICNTTDQPDLQSACPSTVAFGTSCTFQCVAGTSGGTPTAICNSTADFPTGTFTPSLGLCSPCNAGSYSTGGADGCVLCPNLGLTPSTRTTSQSECLCAPGFYEATPGAGDCIGCPSGGYCAGNKDQPVAAPGFFKNSDIFAPCSPAVACTGNNNCARGYTGFACGACEIGFYRLNGYCYPCPNDGPWRIILLVIGGLVAVRALIAVVAPESVGDRTYGLVSINIALSFLQIVATFSDLRIRWPPATRALYDAFSLVNLNIEIVNPECVAPLTFWDKIEIQLLMPIIVLALFLVVWAGMVVVFFVRNKYPALAIVIFHAKKLGKISAAGYMFFMILAYLFLAKAALTLFACNYQGGDVYTLALSPSNLCYQGPWLNVAPLAVFGIIAYIVAVPIVVHVVYLRSRRQYGAAVANNSLFSNFLVAKFRPETWFWEVAVMLRKLLMVIVATFGVGDTYGQVAASFAVILLSVLFSLPANPYKWRKHNLVEHASLFSALAVLFCGLLLSAESIAKNPAAVGAIDALIVISVFVFIFAVLGCLALEIRVYVTVLKLKARLQPDKVTSLQACNTRLVLVVPFRAFILTVSDEGSVRAWHTDSLLPYRAFEMREKVVQATVRGSELYIVNDKGLVVWDIDRQAAVDVRSMHSPVTSLSNSDDLLFLGHENGDLSFWPFKKAKAVETENAAVTITATADSEGVVLPTASTSVPTSCRLHGEATIVAGAHETTVSALKVVGLVLYAADRAGTVRKWSLKTFKCFRQWSVEDLPAGVYISAIEEVATQIAVGTSDGVLRFISVEAESEALPSLRLQIQRISCLTLCNGMLLSASEDGRIIVLSGASGRLLQLLPDAEASVSALSVLEDGTVVYGDAKGILRKYRIIPAWHMRDPDPHVLTKLIAYAKKRLQRKQEANGALLDPTAALSSVELSAAAQQDIYDELGVLAESLDLPAIPWRVLDGASAEAVVLALAGETQKRRDHSEGLRRRNRGASSFQGPAP